MSNLFCSDFPQLVSFGLSNQMVVAFKEENLISFKHLFLKGYNDQNSGTYSVYTQTDVYEHIYFIIDQVSTEMIIYLNL